MKLPAPLACLTAVAVEAETEAGDPDIPPPLELDIFPRMHGLVPVFKFWLFNSLGNVLGGGGENCPGASNIRVGICSSGKCSTLRGRAWPSLTIARRSIDR